MAKKNLYVWSIGNINFQVYFFFKFLNFFFFFFLTSTLKRILDAERRDDGYR